jgi:Glycosyl hydrolases family 16
MADPLTDEQRKNIASSLRSVADVLDPPVVPDPTPAPVPTPPVPTPTPTPTPSPVGSLPPLADRFELVQFTAFNGSSLPPDFYAYGKSRGNEGNGFRDPARVAVRDGFLVITAKGDVSGAVGQNVKQQYGFWEIHARFPKGAGTKPCILLWPGQEKDANNKATWPSWLEYDLVETNSERNGGYCNVHYGDTNHQTGPHNFSGDLSQWHTYGCELTPEGVIFYLDGKVIKSLTGDNVRSKHPHRLGIQLDVSSTGRTGPDTDLLVDWVRVSKPKG